MDKTFHKNIFRALEYRNFRLFFFGQGVSLIGTWMQHIAMSWLVYRMTGSALMLGVVSFLSQIPAFILGPFAGVLADRRDRKKIIIITQSLAMVQAFILAYLTLSGRIEISHIILMGVLLGCINALDIPARQSFLIETIEKKELLGNAIALNSMAFNVARLIGPSIAGVIIAGMGEGVCFLINGVSFIAVLFCLLSIKTTARKHAAKIKNIWGSIKEGIDYAFGFEPIKFILIIISVSSLMGASYIVLMPVVAREMLGGGPKTLGLLMASIGVGAIVGTLYLASKKGALRLGRIIPISSALFSVGLIMFALSRYLWISALLLVIIGFGFMAAMASSNAVLQTIVEDDKRGRVMSFYSMAFMGMTPLGSLLAGVMANKLGVRATLILSGLFCMSTSLIFLNKMPKLIKMIHPIYEKMGMTPELAKGISAASQLTAAPED